MKPVSTMLFKSQLYSDQFLIIGGRPAVGNVSITLLRWECKPVFRPCQNGLLTESASKMGKCWRIRSQIMIALVRTSDAGEQRHSGLSQFVIELDSPGVAVRPIPDLMGEVHFNEVFLNEVFVPAEALLGNEAGQRNADVAQSKA